MAPASLNHIGIAVSDLPRVKKLFEILDLKIDHEENVPEQKVKTSFVPLPREQGYLEFLEPTDPQSPIAKFLAKRGPGIHHLSFLLNKGEMQKVSEKLLAAGFQLIYDKPQAGAHHMQVNFIHPSSAGGMLIEIMEPETT